ncbi:MAG: TM2 domain-containing protein [Lachnospiraceae bacterium]|nr:TM2 domain-containing protein [Lachnospiraceae bacterium]MDE7203211.1 TM2 domain-containing protein [Lachnospiraceae bacterium]
MALINCPHCGKEITDHAASCPHCGTPLGNKKYCKFCGEQIDSDCVICPKCGKQLENINTNNSNVNIVTSPTISVTDTLSAPARPGVSGRKKDKWVAFLLCLFVGFFGVHKFYEGKVGMGILYLFTLGLCGIGWFIDLLIILTKPNPYYV